jgi:hypothetical protein
MLAGDLVLDGFEIVIWTVGCLIVGIAIGYAIKHLVVQLHGGSVTFDQEPLTKMSAPVVRPRPVRPVDGPTGTNGGDSESDPLT